jgi:N-acetyl-gamma-glutamyl-phosphate reductase
MIKVGVVGATGYTGIETLRLLATHPQVEVHVITSRSEKGKAVSDMFPALRGYLDKKFSDPQTKQLTECDVVFFATPNATAMEHVPDLLKAGIRVIDLSADFRLKDANVWSHWYGQNHSAPDLLEQAVYGLPEINRDAISTAQLVANPGCYPTAIILALLPILESGVVSTDGLIADAKSGVSGAGRKAVLNTQFCETSESFAAYAASGHRHLPEICQTLNEVTGHAIDLTFVPHLVPMVRGIHATIYARIKENEADIQKIYEDRYVNEPYVDVLPADSHPDTRSVRGSNFCRIAIHVPQKRNMLVILSVIDNLVKGAAGQAIQNMNIMFGLDECEGIMNPPLSP